MKKYLIALMLGTVLFASCEDDTKQPEPEPTPDPVPGVTTADLGDGSTKFVLAENTTLSADITYTLRGFVYVPEGKTLTIEPGTVIKGEKSSKARPGRTALRSCRIFSESARRAGTQIFKARFWA